LLVLQHLDLAKQRCADSQAAAERGRLVREIRHARQHRADGLWIIAAVRDLNRRLWSRRLAHSPRRDLEVVEAAAVDVTHSWDLARSGGQTVVIDPIAVDMALSTSQMTVSQEFQR
jgi:hypothetical protein